MKLFLVQLLAILLSLAGGVLISLAFPPWNQYWLIWIGFTPVLAGLLLFPRHWVGSLIQGAVFGGTFGGLVFSWLWAGGRQNDWLFNVASLGLVGAIWGLFVRLSVRLPEVKSDRKVAPILPGYGFNSEAWTKSIAHLQAACLTAAAWTMLEWARGTLVPEWNAVGLVLQSNLPLLQIATVTGVSGLSFVVVFANLIALTTVRRIVLEPGRMTWTSRFDVTATLGVIFLAGLAGFWWLQQAPHGDRKSVALICPETVDFERFLELTKQESGKAVDLFVWRCARFAPGDYSRLGDAMIGKTAGLVSGTTSAENGTLSGTTIIIPGAVRNLLLIPGKHDFFSPWAGAISRTLNSFAFADTNWVTFINWDAGDPRLIRAAVNKQAQAIIAVVDPFPGGRGSTEQLFANLRLWSASLGRPVIFASAANFSAIVAGSGKNGSASGVYGSADGGDGGSASGRDGSAIRGSVAHATELESVLTGVIDVPSPFDPTLYGRYGDWFAVACGGLCFAAALVERLRRYREKHGRSFS
ncbi:MAG: hypothetical protein JO279_07165 [Verrucomicrobia bacterium]|nr:hypothetical protein [Verrucomicrobiota bacterium]